ncbi:2-deoxy-D-gluconate 3-dehydrogenase [Actinomadura sp. NBRC 104412]|uniref:SDR family NAD(P)-dependent oxidoreductase n=1 Tax=Actinomadura sp. NBRC 104412 TaxID=3032203 RepID=UPI0024A23931|nr:glucose 1-dehydrogenase [Actinomadura sp. NBRC 104412]GLZ07506.1 2-deoxy-D-gluconate 3-dehydrogenase [Actinomadura sp. NBRC 104412]
MTAGVLDGRVAVVTGSGRGIGAAAALALAGAGADVVLTGRDAGRLGEVAARVRALGRRALPVPADVRDTAAVTAVMDAAVGELGRLDVLVNNSGVVSSMPVLDTTDEEWHRVVDTNLHGAFRCLRAAGRHMVAAGGGKVINIASHFAMKGVARHAVYSASKAALVSLTRSVAVEWAPYGVQVNAIAPGYFATDLNADLRADQAAMERILRQIPARRFGDPAELGAWIVLLASPAGDFVTGQTFVVDGGQTAR